jgi:hypothetical protein
MADLHLGFYNSSALSSTVHSACLGREVGLQHAFYNLSPSTAAVSRPPPLHPTMRAVFLLLPRGLIDINPIGGCNRLLESVQGSFASPIWPLPPPCALNRPGWVSRTANRLQPGAGCLAAPVAWAGVRWGLKGLSRQRTSLACMRKRPILRPWTSIQRGGDAAGL